MIDKKLVLMYWVKHGAKKGGEIRLGENIANRYAVQVSPEATHTAQTRDQDDHPPKKTGTGQRCCYRIQMIVK